MEIKKVYIIVLCVTCSYTSMAQIVSSSIQYRFVYDAQLKTTESSKSLTNDEHYLDVGANNISRYYSCWKEKKKAIMDSIHSLGGNHDDMMKEIQKQGVETSYFDYYVFKNYPATERRTTIIATAEYYQYEEKMNMDWNLLEGDTLVLGYNCNKASTEYNGRVWTAWYSRDIPIADGPWKLCGLPGLILYAYDSKKEFIFTCIGVLKDIHEPITKREDQIVKTSAEKAHRMYELIMSDFDSYLNAKYGGNTKTIKYDKNGKVIPLTRPKVTFIEKYN